MTLTRRVPTVLPYMLNQNLRQLVELPVACKDSLNRRALCPGLCGTLVSMNAYVPGKNPPNIQSNSYVYLFMFLNILYKNIFKIITLYCAM